MKTSLKSIDLTYASLQVIVKFRQGLHNRATIGSCAWPCETAHAGNRALSSWCFFACHELKL